MSTINRLFALRACPNLWTRMQKAQNNALSAQVAELTQKVGQLQKQVHQLKKQNTDLQGKVVVQKESLEKLQRIIFRLYPKNR